MLNPLFLRVKAKDVLPPGAELRRLLIDDLSRVGAGLGGNPVLGNLWIWAGEIS